MNSCRKLIAAMCLILMPAGLGFAAGQPQGGGEPAGASAAADAGKSAGDSAKELSGMSIVGNDEAPKSLYIVPWKGSELGAETTLDTMLDGKASPVDREVFMRQLDYYEVSRGAGAH